MSDDSTDKTRNTDPQKTYHIVPAAISILVLAVLVWDLLQNDTSKLTTPHIILIGLAILPWAGHFVHSLNLSPTGLQADFKSLQQQVSEVVDVVDAATEREPEKSEAEGDTALTEELDTLEANVLEALTSSKYALRSWSGIKNDVAGLSTRQDTEDLLKTLETRNLVRMSIGPKSRKNLWSISPDGFRALEHFKSTETP